MESPVPAEGLLVAKSRLQTASVPLAVDAISTHLSKYSSDLEKKLRMTVIADRTSDFYWSE